MDELTGGGIRVSTSVIIPARNAERTLGNCLESLRSSSRRVDEIIVVDDGSTDGTTAIAERHGVRVIRLQGHLDAYRSRNEGARASSGEILIFLDSDVAIQPDTLDAIIKGLDDESTHALVGIYSAHHRHRGLVSQYKNLWIRYSFLMSPKTIDWLFGAITAIRREVYGRAGGFDQDFSVKLGGGDLEFGKRLTGSGFVIRLDPSVVVEHLKEHTLKSLLKNDFERSQGFVRLAFTLGEIPGAIAHGFANISPGFIVCTMLSWPLVCALILTVSDLELWWFFASIVFVYVALNVPFLRFFAELRGVGEACRALGVLFLDHLACTLGCVKGLVRWLRSR